MADKDSGRVDLEHMRVLYEDARRALEKLPPEKRTVTVRAQTRLRKNLHLEGRVGRFKLEADEPEAQGGTGFGPSPLQYFLAGAAF